MNIVGARIDGRLVHGQVANLWTPKLQADRIIVVDEDAAAFLDLLNLGLKLDTLNVGTMSQTDTTKQVTKQINVEEKDVEDFKKIADKGVKITAQLTPSDDSHDFMKLMNEKIK